MKKSILIIAVLLISLSGQAQKNEYSSVMKETLERYRNGQTLEDYQQLANSFSLIAGTEKGEWLPLYYHAFCYINMSLSDTTGAEKKDAYLDVAEKSIDQAISLVPGESELYTLQAVLFSARLLVNPRERGQEFSGLTVQAYRKALALEANNPRARFIKLRNDVGAARYFGKDPRDYLAQATDLVAKWDEYTVKSPLYPSWGKEQLANLVKSLQ